MRVVQTRGPRFAGLRTTHAAPRHRSGGRRTLRGARPPSRRKSSSSPAPFEEEPIHRRSIPVFLFLLASLSAHLRAQGNEVFPDLEFAGDEGGTVRLSQLKGNVVLLNVWATWCGPCKLELPIVQRLYDRYSDRNFVVLAINVDADRKRVEPFMKRHNISLPVYPRRPKTWRR